MGKRKWSEAEKKLIVLEMLKGQKSVLEVSKEKGVSDALLYRWRDQALKGMPASQRVIGGSGGAVKDV